MKVKYDFVTNSSSSSFIVVFPEKVETIDDVKEYMSNKKAEIVLRDCLDQIPIKMKIDESSKEETSLVNVMDVIYSIVLRRTDECTAEDVKNEINETVRNSGLDIMVPVSKTDNIMIQVEKIYNEKFYRSLGYGDISELSHLIENNDGYIYLFHYSDENGCFWSDMEHGGTFNELPHITMDHH